MTCPHCMNSIPEGATVCGHCNAYKEVRVREPLQLLGSLGVLAVLIAAVLGTAAYFAGRSGYALARIWAVRLGLIAAGSLAVVILIFKYGPKKEVWYHKR